MLFCNSIYKSFYVTKKKIHRQKTIHLPKKYRGDIFISGRRRWMYAGYLVSYVLSSNIM